jgi:hypothetical protein
MHYPKLIPTGSFGSTPKVHSVLLVGQTTAAPEHPPPPELGLRIMPDANFRELRKAEVRRTSLPRTRVNRDKGEGLGCSSRMLLLSSPYLYRPGLAAKVYRWVSYSLHSARHWPSITCIWGISRHAS